MVTEQDYSLARGRAGCQGLTLGAILMLLVLLDACLQDIKVSTTNPLADGRYAVNAINNRIDPGWGREMTMTYHDAVVSGGTLTLSGTVTNISDRDIVFDCTAMDHTRWWTPRVTFSLGTERDAKATSTACADGVGERLLLPGTHLSMTATWPNRAEFTEPFVLLWGPDGGLEESAEIRLDLGAVRPTPLAVASHD